MKQMLDSFNEIFSVIRRDKMILLFSLLPIMIGLIIFSTVGTLIYTDGLAWGERLINEYVSKDTWAGILRYLFVGIITAGFYFLVSFGFVLLVSAIAAPFNDIISKRTQTVLAGGEASSFESSFKAMLVTFFKTIVNELKKISLILLLSILALVLGFIPVLIPIAMVISALLMAINFLDYSWSRNELTFRGCLKNVKDNFFIYTLSGGFFFFLISIPLINLFALPGGVIYFTILFCNRNPHLLEIKNEENIN